MASDSEDSEGEDLSMIRPNLIRELRNVLDQYPDDAQILKELIQNAEDAGATEVKVLIERRSFNQDLPPKTLKRHPHLKFFQGPALCVYNNAEFSARDWEGIRMLHTSIKEEDPLKVGRFGLGFKSVFHLTDHLVILSGEHIMYMDPFKGEQNYCKRHRVSGRKGTELESIMTSLGGVFGVSRDTFQAGGGRFPGTLFWFPLRQSPSELSRTVYVERNVEQLLESFKAEAPSLLLFLNHILSVSILTRDTDATTGPEELFSVGVASPSVGQVQSQRARFIEEIRSAKGGLPESGVACLTEVIMETQDHLTSSTDTQRWLVASYHSGRQQISKKLLKLCSDPQLSYRPYVGVAIPLSDQSKFQSQIFCFLPLPLDTRSPTGLPVHVHGYFALEQNRRHLKWPTADQLDNHAQLDSPSLWNCLLVTELLPRVYSMAIGRLKELNNSDPGPFYAAWPDGEMVHDRWRPLLQPLYKHLEQEPLFFSHVQNGSWVLIRQAVLQRFSRLFSQEVEAAVVQVYALCEQKLVVLPEHVHRCLTEFGLLKGVEVINAFRVSQLMGHSLPHLCRSEKLSLLHFLCQQDKQLLFDLPLLPLADGEGFDTFRRRPSKKGKKGGHISFIHRCPEDLLQLFPGLEAEFCDSNVPEHVADDLNRLADSGLYTLDRLHRKDPRIPALLYKSLQVRFGREPVVSSSDAWVQLVWQYLATYDDLSAFGDIPLLPTKVDPLLSSGNDDTWKLRPLVGVYICRQVVSFSPLSPLLVSALTKLGVTVVDKLPDYVARHRGVLGTFISFPSTQGVLAVIRKVDADKDLRKTAISVFNATASLEEKAAFIHFVSRNRESEGSLPVLFRHLELFTNVLTQMPASIDQVPDIGPEDLPPVPMSTAFLLCNTSERQAAVCLGAKEMTLVQLVQSIMENLSSQQYSQDVTVQFMMYFLKNKKLMKETSLLAIAKGIEFIRTESDELKTAGDLYDPTVPLLTELFYSQHGMLFPRGEFAQADVLKRLRKLGLRREKEVKTVDLINTANRVSEMYSANHQETAKKIAQGLFTYMKSHGQTVSRIALQAIATIPCIPCVQETERPKDYPKSLPLRSSPELVKPAEMSSPTLLYVTGSVMPALIPGLSEGVVDQLQVITEPQPEDVLQHLRNVLAYFRQEEASQYKLVLKEVFQFFADHEYFSWSVTSLKEEHCVLVETGEMFDKPDRFWIQRRPEDIDLKPYRFALPVEIASPMDMENVRDLLSACGSSRCQNESMLHDVLSEIQSKHAGRVSAHPEFHSDFQLVKQILDVLKRSDSAHEGNTLLPVVNPGHPEVLRFMTAKDCTIRPGLLNAVQDRVHDDVGFEIYYVHPDISSSTAENLGALLMKDRALTEVEELDYNYGQHEDLTDRLSNLLKEAYTDGFSVPKELIQNADDAGATHVCFLLDERENTYSRSNLIDEKMADLQGPAIWAFNDAQFSDADFENIVKLGSGTKKDDSTKVGRFGLGFNAVYNLTDVPSFISGHRLAMFDPQSKYIAKGKGGLMLDFRKAANKALLGRMPEQFQPFQDVFGCTLKHSRDAYYTGTLFRFPLRTADQAVNSKLKKDSYSETKRREFLRMLLEKAGSLLMFTQNVKEIEVYYLPSHKPDPMHKMCMMKVRKSGTPTIVHPPELRMDDRTVLQFMKDHWSDRNKDIKIQERIEIELVITEEAKSVCGVKESKSVTHWQLAWASGVDKSARMVQQYEQQGLVPLAAAAISLSEDRLIPVEDSPSGFYSRGHLFCFLPLPEEMVRFSLPVHINGTFALTSDRRGLLVQTEDDLETGESSWNPALFGDAVVRAYLLLLELVKEEAARDSDHGQYFELWPTGSMGCLVDSFYHHLQSDGNRVFPVPDQIWWVSFAESRFLQPDFRDSECGEMAWECLQTFWEGPGYLVDVPSFICNLMEEKGPRGSFKKKVITELAFYRDFFFPHLHDSWWQPECRDILLHHALMKNDKHINQLIKDNPSIPCDFSCQLRTPSELVHPHGEVSRLFLPPEGRFPQSAAKGEKQQDRQKSSNVDFCDHMILLRLSALGMITSELPWEMVLERAESVSVLNADVNTETESLARASYLIEYLSVSSSLSSGTRLGKCPPSVAESLSRTPFLPVLPKPDDWLFPWAGDTPPGSRLLASPKDLFSDCFRDLVSCSVKLLDSSAIKGPGGYLTGKMKDVLKGLGLTMDKDWNDKQFQDFAIRQLLTVAEHWKLNSSSIKREHAQSVTFAIYSYLMNCLKYGEEDVKDSVHTWLFDKEVVWTGTDFVQPFRVAFRCQYDCSPHLFQLERSLLSNRAFFETIGVKAQFEADDVLSVLENLSEMHANIVLTDDVISLVSRLAQLVGEIVKEIVKSTESEPLDMTRVYLPDSNGIMQPASDMCVDDCEWLGGSDRMRFVNGMIAPDIAQVLGVKSKRGQDYDLLTEPIPTESFGQHEELTSRIARLLEGYTFDASLWKELIQNADDAGATEAKLIMDFRTLGTGTLPEKWEVLQGPAFCFYNNRSFSTEDIQGIQKLGVGSKGEDALKIGQFGVGFNSVFHITDVPSFWTKENDETDVICVFDPNCRYVPKTKQNRPGTKFTDIKRMSQQYP
ncbi:sacsin-like [Babylonia areolata]|uniref:sacsin-like n=1 Tax=Babylonia areolata TaxID=304850 RepID=UPI003FD1B27E